MKGRQIILDHVAGRPAAARLVDGALDDLLVAPPGDRPAPGTVFRGRIDRPMKGQGGVTVRLPGGAAGYLRQAKGLSQGAPVLVQVTGYAPPGKAVPLTMRLSLRSRYVVATPGAPGLNVSRAIRDEERRVTLLEILHDSASDGPVGMILRSLSEAGDDADIAADIRQMAALAAGVAQDADGAPERLVEGPDPHAVAWTDWGFADQIDDGAGSFERHGVDDRIAALATPRFDMPGGGYAFVEPTQALVAVDVNTGADMSLAAGLKANLALARALPVQLRLRGLGGQIVIDPAPMPRKDRRTFEQALGRAFRPDPVDTVLAGWTPLGLFELQRRRDRLPLSACLT